MCVKAGTGYVMLCTVGEMCGLGLDCDLKPTKKGSHLKEFRRVLSRFRKPAKIKTKVIG